MYNNCTRDFFHNNIDPHYIMIRLESLVRSYSVITIIIICKYNGANIGTSTDTIFLLRILDGRTSYYYVGEHDINKYIMRIA